MKKYLSLVAAFTVLISACGCADAADDLSTFYTTVSDSGATAPLEENSTAETTTAATSITATETTPPIKETEEPTENFDHRKAPKQSRAAPFLILRQRTIFSLILSITGISHLLRLKKFRRRYLTERL